MGASAWKGRLPTGEFPYRLFCHCPSLYEWHFGLHCSQRKGCDIKTASSRRGTDYQKKMWQLVAQAIPAEQPVLCHREAKLWRWERPGVPRVTTENKLFEMAQWEEVLKKIPNSNNNNKNVMRRKRQKKTKQLPTVFLIKMSSTVVAIAKHNNRAWTCKFRNIQCIVRHDWTN